MSRLVDASADFNLVVLLANQDGTIATPDATPIFRVYGPSGLVGSGSLAAATGGRITGVTNANPAVLTSASHGLVVGVAVDISGVGGATGVNGRQIVSAVGSANLFSVAAAAGGVYTSGGVWVPAGLWVMSVDGSLRSSLEDGVGYTVMISWAEGTTPKGLELSILAI